jgi:transformation/transcription domain-associated protein
VNEEDMMLGLWRKRCASDLTRVSLALVQHGMWGRAQELLGEAQRQAAANQLQVRPAAGDRCACPARLASRLVRTSSPGLHFPTPTSAQVSRGERAVWVDQWTRCARQLSQWDSLTEYARATDSSPLQLDCMWRTSDWAQLAQALPGGAGGAALAQVEETPQVRGPGRAVWCVCEVGPAPAASRPALLPAFLPAGATLSR